MTFDAPLPIDTALPALTAALSGGNAAVLVAPPGAGKTTRVPLVLAREPWVGDRKILMLEPRRLAARAAAERMAATLGERVGETVGLRVRFGSRVSRNSRIEVLTEGIFTRLILDRPDLPDVAAVLFDEFHERSLDADLGLALARDAQQGLREDLKILVMSATLDGARVARLLGGAPVIESAGRAFPVETRYLGRDPRMPVERQMADAIRRALDAEAGSILAFLPGAGEIRRTEALLNETIADATVDVVALHGTLEASVQDRAIAPSPAGRRKVVLATSIAETSLTIDGVRIVIDSGLARVPRYEPEVAIARLETVRVSRASADQRAGRAGRLGPGICYRLWDEPETVSLEPYSRPEILNADLSSFALDLAQWGAGDLSQLSFLDSPPAAALAEARALLRELGALDGDGRITPQGRRLRELPLPPRLSRMIFAAAEQGAAALAADIAVLLTERGLGGRDVDLTHRLDNLRHDRSRRGQDARAMARRWAETAQPASECADGPGAGAVLARAYPDRVARNRGGAAGAFLLANGRGGTVDATSALAREPFLVVAELSGSAAQGRIVLAAPISLAEIEAQFSDRLPERTETVFEPASATLRKRRVRRLGAIVFAEQTLPVQCDAETASVLCAGLLALGLHRLPWSKAMRQWRDRVSFLRRSEGGEWPDLSDAALAARADEWLLPLADGKAALSDIGADELADAVMALVPWNLRRKVEAEAPTHFEAPTGTRVAIDYEAEAGPTVAVRVQELFGLAQHPSIAGGRVPLVVELLSPAQRPVQVTRDLPGFWRGSYEGVRSEMKGRYPKHPGPEDPLAATPTRRAKPRGQ